MIEPLRSAGALARGFAALTYPRCLVAMAASAALSIVLAVGLWFLLRWALFDWQFFNWAWANWLIRQFGGVALFVLMVLLMPALLAVVVSIFFDTIIGAVERRHYPDLPPPRRQSVVEIGLYTLRLTALIVVANVIALPFYLLLPGINFLIAWSLNGYLFGREYFEALAMRRLAPRQMRQMRLSYSGRLFRAGVIVALLKTVPLLNLLMPVVACAYFTHLFYALPWRSHAAASERR
jgi:uncharacterized protein involved in cysteine biosynthesis